MTATPPTDPAPDADQAAARWLVRRQDGLAPDETAEFEAWLAAAPAHRAALERLEGTWRRLDTLPAAELAALRARTRAATPPRRGWQGTRRWMPLAAAACALFVVAGGWALWQQQPVYAKTFATARGQQLDVQLPDGSALRLDTATRAEVTLYRQRREVRLPEGQAHFSVQADAERPFDVLAGPLRITVVGTRFSVRHTQAGLDAGGVRVTVEEGRVRVAPADPAAGAEPRLLGPGEAVAGDAGGRLRSAPASPAAGALLWREGRANFENTPLAQALAEFERYGPTGLTVRDPAVAAMRINGSFDLRQFDAFAKALPQVLPVRLQPREGTTEIAPR
jgi:transmembrane sensor